MERFTVTATSKRATLPYTSFPLKPQHRDPTFSPYLHPDQPKSVPQEPISFQVIDETEISIFDAERYFNEGQDQNESKKASPSRTNLDDQSVPRLSSVSSVDGYGRTYRTGSFNATPTASSEASWNSQTGLLSNPPGSIAVSMRNLQLNEKKKKAASGNWFFRRKCPCSGKKSVQVEEIFSETKSPSRLNCNSSSSMSYNIQSSKTREKQGTKTGEVGVTEAPKEVKAEEVEESLGNEERTKMKFMNSKCAKEEEVVHDSDQLVSENHFPTELARRIIPSGGGFSFPILNPSPIGKLVLSNGKHTTSTLEDPPRESLEVFKPSDESLGLRKSSENRLDGNHRRLIFPMSPKFVDDEVMSDASSDLFEIESLSTQSTLYPNYLRRDSLDENSNYDTRPYVGNGPGNLNFRRNLYDSTATPSIAPTECYEPSEVSIDWSVTTAEGFDRGSVTNVSISASEFDYIGATGLEPRVTTMAGKRRGNGLLSCRCEKAVNVAPPPHPMKFGQERYRLGATIPIESGRFQVTPRLGDMGSMQMKNDSSNNVQKSHSARMSLAALATR